MMDEKGFFRLREGVMVQWAKDWTDRVDHRADLIREVRSPIFQDAWYFDPEQIDYIIEKLRREEMNIMIEKLEAARDVLNREGFDASYKLSDVEYTKMGETSIAELEVQYSGVRKYKAIPINDFSRPTLDRVLYRLASEAVYDVMLKRGTELRSRRKKADDKIKHKREVKR